MSDAITREEKLMEAIANGSVSNIKPITREEIFLAKAGGQDVETPEPITRREKLLQEIIDNGGGGGGALVVTYNTYTEELSHTYEEILDAVKTKPAIAIMHDPNFESVNTCHFNTIDVNTNGLMFICMTPLIDSADTDPTISSTFAVLSLLILPGNTVKTGGALISGTVAEV